MAFGLLHYLLVGRRQLLNTYARALTFFIALTSQIMKQSRHMQQTVICPRRYHRTLQLRFKVTANKRSNYYVNASVIYLYQLLITINLQ